MAPGAGDECPSRDHRSWRVRDAAGVAARDRYRHGRLYDPVERASGGALDTTPTFRYLKAKLSELYGLAPETVYSG